ncbi:MAG: hypothetical protein V3V75_11000 [Thermoguttaceae bacterium]
MLGKSTLSGGQRAKSSAIEREISTNAPDLRAIIDAWPTLPPADRERLAAMLMSDHDGERDNAAREPD